MKSSHVIQRSEIHVRRLDPLEIQKYLRDIVQFRIQIFRTFPYLYDGDEKYEMEYLARYIQSPKSALIGAFVDKTLVGVATANGVDAEDIRFREAFVSYGCKPEQCVYFGESLLLPEYRGLGIGHRFFDEREKFAKEICSALECTGFASVIRPEAHLQRPPNDRSHDLFWTKRGYAKKEDIRVRYLWKDIDQPVEDEKEMVFWFKDWKI